MKNEKMLLTGMLVFLTAIFAPLVQAQTQMDEFMAKWENSKQFTLEVVEAMPDDKMDYKPHESAMSFKEQIIHLSSAMAMMSQRFLDGTAPDFALDSKPSSKAELKEHVTKCYDYAKKTFENVDESKLGDKVDLFGNSATRRQALALINDHTTHHRGAAVSYLRFNGIEPPRFRAL